MAVFWFATKRKEYLRSINKDANFISITDIDKSQMKVQFSVVKMDERVDDSAPVTNIIILAHITAGA